MKQKADTPGFLPKNAASKCVLLAGALTGICSFAYFYAQGLSTAHYDAKAHLVIARRLIDSPHPGYSQMGAQWLPLVHLLYLPFVMMDSQYRTAIIPSLLSVCAFAISGWLAYRIAARLTGSTPAGLFAAAVVLANPNLEFLQSAPLTEPVYTVFALLALDSYLMWRGREESGKPRTAALWATAGAMCRYEGWLFIAGVIALTGYDCWRRTISVKRALGAAATFAGTFAVPALLHFGFIYLRVGDSFFQRVARGNPLRFETYRRPVLSAVYLVSELAQAAGIIPLLAGLAGVAYCVLDRNRLRRRLPYLLLWLPLVLSFLALYWGLMYRVRYSALVIPAVGVFGSLTLATEVRARRVLILCAGTAFILPWISWAFPQEWAYHFVYPGAGIMLLPAAALILLLASAATRKYGWALPVLVVLGMQAPVLEGEYHAMLSESLEHQYLEPEQRMVLLYWREHYGGERILIDMGRLAPLMYDSGIPLKNFVCHDGDPGEWERITARPRDEAGWICAENGDEVWQMLQVDPRLTDGYSLAVKTENYVLYRLNADNGAAQVPARQYP